MKCSYCRQSSTKTDSRGNCPACGAEYTHSGRTNIAIETSTTYSSSSFITRATDRKTGQAIYDNFRTVDDPEEAIKQDTK